MAFDYSKTIFDKGLVCFNTNNQRLCVVLDGNKGDKTDRCSLVLEQDGECGFIINTPPNRALVPTGRIHNLSLLKEILERVVFSK